jgi:hypothetical protein
MATFKKRKRIIVQKIILQSGEFIKQVEIRLPANVKKITGIAITGK